MPANDLNFRKKAYVQVRHREVAARPCCGLPHCHMLCRCHGSACWCRRALGHSMPFAATFSSWQELNGFIGLKKAYVGGAAARAELLDGAKSESQQLAGGCCGQSFGGIAATTLDLCVCRQHTTRLPSTSGTAAAPARLRSPPRRCHPTLPSGAPRCLLPCLGGSPPPAAPAVLLCPHHIPRTGCATRPAGKSTQELMQLGRRDMKETDASLLRSEKIVNDTMAIGIQTAETLQAQTRQLEKVGAGGARREVQLEWRQSAKRGGADPGWRTRLACCRWAQPSQRLLLAALPSHRPPFPTAPASAFPGTALLAPSPLSFFQSNIRCHTSNRQLHLFIPLPGD